MIELKDITCGYGKRVVLAEINFGVDKGSFTGVIGPNAAGKTTLLRVITGIVKPLKGEVFFQGKKLREIGHQELSQKIAVVSQNVAPPPMRVEEFVLLGRIPYFRRFQLFEKEEDIEIVKECLKLTGTYELKKKYLTELSGGEKRLVLLAKALAQKPQLLLLDEPVAYLDISHQLKTLELIKKLNRQFSLTVIITLHDLNLAGQFCDYLVLLNQGKIFCQGKPTDVLKKEIIEEVFKTKVVVRKDYLTQKPYLLVSTKEE